MKAKKVMKPQQVSYLVNELRKTLVFASKYEAKPFLKRINLKKYKENGIKFYKKYNLNILITGIGQRKTVKSLNKYFNILKPDNNDIIINVGIAGSKYKQNEKSKLCFINKIRDNKSSDVKYPSVIFDFNLEEKSLETFNKPVSNPYKVTEDLVDMEGYSFFKTSNNYLNAHQIFLFKVISDYLSDLKKLTLNKITDLINRKYEEIYSILDKFNRYENLYKNIFSKIELEKVESLVENLNLTFTQKSEILDILKYYKLKHNNLSIVDDYIDKKVNSKNERDSLFKELKSEIIQ